MSSRAAPPRGLFGTYRAGDRFRVAVEGGIVRYRRNGVLFYTSAVTPAYPLLVDTALYSPAPRSRDVVLSGDLGEAVTWTAAVSVSASTGADEDGRARLERRGNLDARDRLRRRVRVVHDGRGDDPQADRPEHRQYRNGFRGRRLRDPARRNGTFYVFESGTSRGVFGAYVAGDRFQVAVEGGVVKYLKNGAVFYTSGVRRRIRCWSTRRSTRRARRSPMSCSAASARRVPVKARLCLLPSPGLQV